MLIIYDLWNIKKYSLIPLVTAYTLLQTTELIYSNHWLSKIHRDDSSSTTANTSCSVHFREIDFRLRSTDSCLRLQRNPILRRRTLKADAIPSIFPNQPAYDNGIESAANVPCNWRIATKQRKRNSTTAGRGIWIEWANWFCWWICWKIQSPNPHSRQFFPTALSKWHLSSVLFLSVNEDSSLPTIHCCIRNGAWRYVILCLETWLPRAWRRSCTLHAFFRRVSSFSRFAELFNELKILIDTYKRDVPSIIESWLIYS